MAPYICSFLWEIVVLVSLVGWGIFVLDLLNRRGQK